MTAADPTFAEPATVALVAGVFLLAGLVKGIVGLGLPTVSLGLLTASLGLQPAMALMLLPAFATNLLQALAGGALGRLSRRLWPFLLAGALTIWLGAAALTRVRSELLAALLGLLLVLYALYGLAGPQLRLPARWEGWAGPLAGALNGVLTGMTGSLAFPGVPYLQSLDLPRDALVQAMGLLFAVSSLALAVAMGGRGLLSWQLGILSGAALLPALAGLWLGQRLRRRLPEATFRRVLLLALLLLGAWMIARNLG